MAFGELLLSASLQVALDRLVPREFKEFTRCIQVDSYLEDLEETIFMIQGMLHDAEQKQIMKPGVRKWLDKLTHLVYDIDDLLDEVATDAQRLKMEEKSQPHQNQVRELLLYLREFWSKAKQSGKIKTLIGRLDKVVQQGQRLGLRQCVGQSSSGVSQRPLTGSLVNPSHVYGREQDVKQILEMLSLDVTGSSNFSVTSIVGLGGVGKTTLAQLLYNHESLNDLNPKGWVCISDRFDVTRITKAILESITGTSHGLSELQPLQVSLKGLLNEKKFLIVLDDIWTENSSDWHALRAPFEVGCRGSKIIVTTRSTQVASMIGSVHVYHLNKLSDEDCRALFNQHAFENESPNAHPQLKSIAEKIVEKCDGLPLAAKALGGLLCGKQDITEWEFILNSEIWDPPGDKSGILPSLKLSYHYLPAHLKQCFSYCAIFPQDYVFHKKELILLWMAEGFLQPKGNRKMEDVGDEYFRALLSRSFFLRNSNDQSRGVVMHDLIHDLARYVSRGICFYFKDGLEGDNSLEADMSSVRYALMPVKEYQVMARFEVLHEAKNLRTLLLKLSGPFSFVPKRLPQYLFSRVQCLRVLCLSKIWTNFELPESIANLMHLRYLNLSRTGIKKLPLSLSTLWNLQTLLLRECSHLEALLSDMGNLTGLRHLDIHGCFKLKRMPLGMNKLKNLQTLSLFVIGENSGSSIEVLNEMKQLRENLCIVGLKNVVNIYGSILWDKEHLDDLELNWGFSSEGYEREDIESTNGVMETSVIEGLRSHTNLKSLTITWYYGTRFPNWLVHSSYSKLVSIELVHCRRCRLLPPLGSLPSLKYLLLHGLWGIKSVGDEFYGGVLHASNLPFRSLEELIFREMKDWKEWFGINDEEREVLFPQLRNLKVDNCPRLRKFSHGFVKLEVLEIVDCPKLVALPRCLPVLCRLVVVNCGVVALPRCLPMLCGLEVSKCDAIVLRSLVDYVPPRLNFLRISRISNLKVLLVPREGDQARSLLGCLNALTELKIEDCQDLMKLLSLNDVRQRPQYLESLRTLKISQCPQLARLSDDDVLPLKSLTHLEIRSCPNLHFVKLPSTLEILWIHSCRRLNIRMVHCTSLRELMIDYWPGLVCFEEKVEWPSTLRKLRISECNNLKTFPALMMRSNNNNNDSFLDTLKISICESLTSFTTGSSSNSTGFPLLPKRLHIEYCKNLPSLPESMICSNRFLEHLDIISCDKLTALPNDMYMLTSLRSLRIKWCRSLVSFPNGGLPTTTLINFEIRGCESLKSLPDGLHHATSLQSLSITECPNLDPFLEEGFPCNLHSLKITSCVKEKPFSEWRFHNLTSLRRLAIGGFLGLVFFSECLLPPNLTFFHIESLPDLQYLPEGLHSLISLERLNIKNCEKLASLPEKGMPSSLARLRINGCPMLEERCVEEKGEDWSKIADIPLANIPDGHIGLFSSWEDAFKW